MSRPPRNGQGHLAAQAVQILVGGGGQTQLAAAVLAAQVHGVPVDLDAIAGAAAAAADAAPGGNVLQLRQHLIHNNVVGEGLRVLRLLLGGPDGQLLHLGGHLVLLAHIAADLPGFGAGQADAPASQHCVGAALGLVRFAAQAAGHPQAEAGAVGLDEHVGLAAGALDMGGGRRQGKGAAPGHDRPSAFGADIAEAPGFFHDDPSLYSSLLSVPHPRFSVNQLRRRIACAGWVHNKCWGQADAWPQHLFYYRS